MFTFVDDVYVVKIYYEKDGLKIKFNTCFCEEELLEFYTENPECFHIPPHETELSMYIETTELEVSDDHVILSMTGGEGGCVKFKVTDSESIISFKKGFGNWMARLKREVRDNTEMIDGEGKSYWE